MPNGAVGEIGDGIAGSVEPEFLGGCICREDDAVVGDAVWGCGNGQERLGNGGAGGANGLIGGGPGGAGGAGGNGWAGDVDSGQYNNGQFDSGDETLDSILERADRTTDPEERERLLEFAENYSNTMINMSKVWL